MSLITRCWSSDPSQRPKLRKVIRELREMAEKVLEYTGDETMKLDGKDSTQQACVICLDGNAVEGGTGDNNYRLCEKCAVDLNN